ncbi:MAG: hypothetical protein Kow0022_06390 [Phycisphaerales bacterium]
MPGRRHTPLFEHLAKDREETLPPVEASHHLPAERDERASIPPPVQGRVNVSFAAVYGFIAAALALAVAAWTIGYRLGYSAGEKSVWQSQSDPIVLPSPGDLATPNADAAGSENTRPASDTKPESDPTPPRTTAANTSAGILSPDGTLYTDPRIPGSNYLELATLTRDQAESAIRFLAARGVKAIGVPVESGARSANNPTRYRLVSLKLSVPSDQFRESGARRRAHEDEIKRLGAEWQNEGGASNFAKPQWTRFP